ncbi:MAG: hypothetical protein ABII89_04645 [Candidatus Omnitrophota bacterium]
MEIISKNQFLNTRLLPENNYQFREFLAQTHLPDRRNPDATPETDEIVVDADWQIAVRKGVALPIIDAAKDLQDYFFTSMGVSLAIQTDVAGDKKTIFLDDKGLNENPRAYAIECRKDDIRIIGESPRGTAQGCYYLEDLMNLREAPFVETTDGPVFRKPLFSPRMVHSGWGLDEFPDVHLNAIAHAGFDTILVFAKGVDRTTRGQMDFNDLIRRAGRFGLDVYFYSYLNSFKHPDDPDSDAFFEAGYGTLFKHCPGAKGIILVGESCQFPSKDPATSGRASDDNNSENAGIADHRSAPGWWPCRDYPQWLNAIKKAVRRYQPDADVVFWTYNWGWAPEKPRLELIDSLPLDVSLLVTFEMFEPVELENYTALVPDYTITSVGPGRYFTSEAEAASRRGLRLYTMSNTGGMTWDMGVVPYIPTPQQWFKRYAKLRAAKEKWGLSGLMDSHHYGWWPSPVCECAKWSFWNPEVDLNQLLLKIAARDFGAAAETAVAAWRKWSEAIASYIPGFDDQAGPLRIGPAYPLVFHPCLYPYAEQKMKFPDNPAAHFGAKILHTLYNPEHIYGHTACGRRIREEIPILEKALALWDEGSVLMVKALAATPPAKRKRAAKIAGVGRFFGHGLRTMLHVKRWWLLNKRLEIEWDFETAGEIMDELEAIAHAERINVESAVPLADADSRLGWEPSMEYMTDKWHLEWKLRQLDNLLTHTLKAYRSTLRKNPQK